MLFVANLRVFQAPKCRWHTKITNIRFDFKQLVWFGCLFSARREIHNSIQKLEGAGCQDQELRIHNNPGIKTSTQKSYYQGKCPGILLDQSAGNPNRIILYLIPKPQMKLIVHESKFSYHINQSKLAKFCFVSRGFPYQGPDIAC